MLGYHGVSSRSVNQHQSGAFAIAIHTGAKRPARCAGAEWQVIVTSRFIITAAVSMNGRVVWFSRGPRSVTGNFPSSAWSWSSPWICWMLNKPHPGDPRSGSKLASGIERRRSSRCRGLPGQLIPTLISATPASSRRQCSTRSGSAKT